MKDCVVAVRDHYENIRGVKKIKVLTKGKKYVYLKDMFGHYKVVNDLDVTGTYRKSLFTTVSNSRNNKLDLLGI
jgi:hypothetical protein